MEANEEEEYAPYYNPKSEIDSEDEVRGNYDDHDADIAVWRDRYGFAGFVYWGEGNGKKSEKSKVNGPKAQVGNKAHLKVSANQAVEKTNIFPH